MLSLYFVDSFCDAETFPVNMECVLIVLTNADLTYVCSSACSYGFYKIQEFLF